MLARIPRPVFILALLAIFALGLALGTNALIARKLSVSPERLAAARSGAPSARTATPASELPAGEVEPSTGAGDPGEPVAARSSRARTALRGVAFWMDAIVNRNLFDSTNALLGQKDAPAEEPNLDGEIDKKSEIAATLIATSVASEPIWSTALISTDTEGVNVYRIDEQILDAVIKDIQRPTLELPARVILLRNGTLEYLEAGERRAGSSATPKGSDEEAPTKGPKAVAGQHDWSGIKNTGENKYELPEADVKYALDNLDKMAREARVVPNFADGKTNGFKVFAIRRNSALRNMGLTNNDVLTSVNGHDLSNTEKALEIYSKLQSEKSLSLEILRDGQPVTLEYDIR